MDSKATRHYLSTELLSMRLCGYLYCIFLTPIGYPSSTYRSSHNNLIFCLTKKKNISFVYLFFIVNILCKIIMISRILLHIIIDFFLNFKKKNLWYSFPRFARQLVKYFIIILISFFFSDSFLVDLK